MSAPSGAIGLHKARLHANEAGKVLEILRSLASPANADASYACPGCLAVGQALDHVRMAIEIVLNEAEDSEQEPCPACGEPLAHHELRCATP